MRWVKMSGALLAFCGVFVASMMLAVGFSLLEALICLAGLLMVLWALGSRPMEAQELQMRESSWNTPDEDETA